MRRTWPETMAAAAVRGVASLSRAPLRRVSRLTTAFRVDDGAGQWAVSKPSPGFGGPADVGGVEALLASPVDTREKSLQVWELQTHAFVVSLVTKKLLTVDELRRCIEALEPDRYEAFSYYERWAAAAAQALLERGVVTPTEIDAALGHARTAPLGPPAFRAGNVVRVRRESFMSRWRKPHLRTPGYLFGASGTVESYAGAFEDPAFLAFASSAGGHEHLYRVRFAQAALWPEGGKGQDTVVVDIYEPWLERMEPPTAKIEPTEVQISHVAHDHDHEHDHVLQEEGPERPGQRLAAALIALADSKALVPMHELRACMESVETTGTRAEGPRLVARAWTDPAFKARLLHDATAAAAELGIVATNSTAPTVLKAVEATDAEHQLVVCTLCSCYPLSILGLSPAWYKSTAYRARAVREPRRLLAEAFGLELPATQAIRVHDSTADLRFIVIPKRPEGTEAWPEEELAKLVTRDSMIGTAVCRARS